MKLKLNAETWKFVGGALVVLAAVCIIMPDLLGYLQRLWRLGMLIAAIILLAWAAALVITKIKLSKSSPVSKEGDPQKRSEKSSI